MEPEKKAFLDLMHELEPLAREMNRIAEKYQPDDVIDVVLSGSLSWIRYRNADMSLYEYTMGRDGSAVAEKDHEIFYRKG